MIHSSENFIFDSLRDRKPVKFLSMGVIPVLLLVNVTSLASVFLTRWSSLTSFCGRP